MQNDLNKKWWKEKVVYPIYESPNDDMGYDVSDYRAIMSEFGTMEDFDTLLKGLHQSGIKLIMDLVFMVK